MNNAATILGIAVMVTACDEALTSGGGNGGAANGGSGGSGAGLPSGNGASNGGGSDGVAAGGGVVDCSGDPLAAPASPDNVIAVPGVTVATLAGSSTMGDADGLGADAQFSNPANIVINASGQLFIADYDNGSIRSATSAGMVSTLTSVEGFARPFGLAIGAGGTLYVGTDFDEEGMNAGLEGGVLWRLDMTSGAPTPVAVAAGRPRGLQAMGDDRLAVSDVGGHDLRWFDLGTESFSDFAGERGCPGFADGSAGDARFNRPYGIARTSDGDLLVADQLNHRIRRVTPDGVVTTIAGDGRAGLIDGPMESSRFNLPQALAVDAEGNIYVSDVGNHRIRRISTDGVVGTIAGSGVMGFMNGDGLDAQFSGQEGLVMGANGVLYVADGTNGEVVPFHRVRVITLP